MIPLAAHVSRRRRRREGGDGEDNGLPRAVLLAGVIALFVGFAIFLVYQKEAEKADRSDTTAVLDSLRQAAGAAATLLARDARLATLSPTPSGPPDGRGRAVYDPATADIVLVFDRLRTEPGTVPVLWALSEMEPRYLSTLEPDATGRAVLHLDDAGGSASIDALAVSLEPSDAGIPATAPAGPVILLGPLER